MGMRVLTRGRDIAKAGALDETGRLKLLPHAFWAEFTADEVAMFCLTQGVYCVPTVELVDWLRETIGGSRAIEIGSGCGLIAASLGIPATDNRMQQWPEIRATYLALRQAPVKYGDHVLELDAAEAVRTLQPEIVVAAWVTHKFRPHEEWRKGNMHGVEEDRIVEQARYIHVGNEAVHSTKPILEMPHERHYAPWLVSRAMASGRDFIGVWSR